MGWRWAWVWLMALGVATHVAWAYDRDDAAAPAPPASPQLPAPASPPGVLAPTTDPAPFAPPAPAPEPAPTPTPAPAPTPGPQLVPRYKVETFGSAPRERPNAREDAINDALRRAVEQAGGIKLESGSASQDMALVSDYIITESCGIIQAYTVLQENPNQDGLYYVRVSAICVQSKADIDRRIREFESLMHQVGRPRMMLVGAVDGRPFDRFVTRALNDTLDERGFTVMSLDNLDERKREDMVRRIQVDHDAALANIIDSEIKADYYVVVNTTLNEQPPVFNDVTQLSLYPIGANASIEVVQHDSSRLMASKSVDEPVRNYSEPVTGRRKAQIAAAQAALNLAIARIAQHWLHDFNGRFSIGGDIEVVLDRYAFARISALIQSLRKVKDVERVDIDSIDEKGRSSLRVTTRVSSADLAMMLTQIDPALGSIRTTKNQVEIGEVTLPPPTTAPAVDPPPHVSFTPILKISLFISTTLVAALGLIIYLRQRYTY